MTVEASHVDQSANTPHPLMLVPFINAAGVDSVRDWLAGADNDLPFLCRDAVQAGQMLLKDNGNLLILRPSTDEVIAGFVQNGMDMSDALYAWCYTSQRVLDLVRKNRRRVTIIGFNILRSDPAAAFAAGGLPFHVPSAPFPVVPPDDILRLAAQAALRQSHNATRLVGEWQAASVLVDYGPLSDPASIFAAAQAQKAELGAIQDVAATLSDETQALRDDLTREIEKALAFDTQVADHEKQRTFLERALVDSRSERDALLQQLIKSQDILIGMRLDDRTARELSAAKDDLRAQKAQTDVASEKAAQALRDLQAAQNDIAALRDALARATNGGSAHAARVGVLERELSQANDKLVAQLNVAKSMQAQLNKVTVETGTLQSALQGEVRNVQAHQARGRILEQDLTDSRQEKDVLLRQLMNTHEVMARLRGADEASRVDLNDQKAARTRLETDLAKEIAGSKKHKEEIARLKDRLDKRDKDVKRIMSSSSMRMTAPLRRLRSIFTRN